MIDLFPFIPSLPEEKTSQLPLFCDVAIDYEKGTPIFYGSNPIFVDGLEAVKSWAWRILHTARYRFSHFSWDVGCELESLIGQAYSGDTKLAEVSRYVYDALIVSPYITAVSVEGVALSGSTLSMTVKLSTVYGEAKINV